MHAIVDPDAPPATRTRARRRWWRFRLPWVKTAVSAPTDDDELLIDNTTEREWVLYLGYRNLGIIPANSQAVYRVAKIGLLTARRVDAPVGERYLTLHISPSVRIIQIVDISGGEGFYELQVAAGRQQFRDTA